MMRHFPGCRLPFGKTREMPRQSRLQLRKQSVAYSAFSLYVPAGRGETKITEKCAAKRSVIRVNCFSRR